MKNAVDGLEPRRLWHHFYALSQIPRCSKQEAQARDYVLGVAEQYGRKVREDETGNAVIDVPASPGCQDVPLMVLQAHLDMVCEKNQATSHDFATEGLRLIKKGEWVSAVDTTLGADNGIGVAACLAVLESEEIRHGPLELLFTVDEETGLTGAMDMAPDLLQGRMMINTDSEEDGVLYIGCAGGRNTELILALETSPPSMDTVVRLHLGGLLGGHSGIEIDKGRANAIRLLARFLWKEAHGLGLRVARFEGGNKRNAIPRECEAVVYLRDDNREALKKALVRFEKTLKDEYGPAEPHVFFSMEENGFDQPDSVFDPAFQEKLLNLMFALPNGVIAMSHATPGLVQTSTNLGIAQMRGSEFRIATSQRSSVPSQMTEIVDVVCALGKQAGARIHQGGGYPGWQPKLDSSLLKTARSAFESLFDKAPDIKTIHAGLECGIIGDKFPGMDIISFGPTILGAHSPSERVHIPAVARFWDLLVALLERLAG